VTEHQAVFKSRQPCIRFAVDDPRRQSSFIAPLTQREESTMSKQATARKKSPAPVKSSTSEMPSLVGKAWKLDITFKDSGLPEELRSFCIDFQQPDPENAETQLLGGAVDGLSATYALMDGKLTMNAINQPCISFKVYKGDVTYDFTPAVLLEDGGIQFARLIPTLKGFTTGDISDDDVADDPTWSAQAQPHFP
jgi:hypothetical protein